MRAAEQPAVQPELPRRRAADAQATAIGTRRRAVIFIRSPCERRLSTL